MGTTSSAPAVLSDPTILLTPGAPSVLVVGEGARAAQINRLLAATELLVLRSGGAEDDDAVGRPDLVLVAVDALGPVERAILETLSVAGSAKVVVVAEVEDPAVLVAAVSAGVDGWILPGTAPAETVERLVRVARGEPGFCPLVTAMLVTALRAITRSVRLSVQWEVAPGSHGLTAREREVQQAVQAGKSVRQIAADLSLSEVTVRWHAGRASKKLHRSDRPSTPEPVPVVPGPAAAPPLPAVVRPVRRPALSPAESRVAHLVAEGLSNPQVAERLSISRHTVESHLKQVFGKLGVRSRVQLTRALLTTTTKVS